MATMSGWYPREGGQRTDTGHIQDERAGLLMDWQSGERAQGAPEHSAWSKGENGMEAFH